MDFIENTLGIDLLLLDPNNYRFFDLPSWRRRLAIRFHDTGVQDSTLKLMESTARYGLNELRESILSNGYIPLERIIVTQYEHAEGHYLIMLVKILDKGVAIFTLEMGPRGRDKKE